MSGREVYACQVKYHSSPPLHPSQRLIESNEAYSVYEYWVAPTLDFRQEVLRHGPTVEVLEPATFREEVKDDIMAMVALYKD